MGTLSLLTTSVFDESFSEQVCKVHLILYVFYFYFSKFRTYRQTNRTQMHRSSI